MDNNELQELKNLAYIKAQNISLIDSVRIEAMKAYALLTMAENHTQEESEWSI